MSDALHLGVTLPMDGTHNIQHAARQAEAHGLDGVWAGDHLVTGAPVLDSTLALTAAAAVTERPLVPAPSRRRRSGPSSSPPRHWSAARQRHSRW